MKNKILTELPKTKGNKNNWKQTIGMNIEVMYRDIVYSIKVLEYNRPYVKCKYKNRTMDINISGFVKCAFGELFGLIQHNYIYNIGDVVNTKSGKILITNQIKTKNNDRAYNYKCLIDNYDGEITENNLKIGRSCPICSGNNLVVKGVNDIATTNPDLIKYFKNKNDTQKYKSGSGKKVKLKCPICDYEKMMQVDKLTRRGFCCDICGEKISYPQKVMGLVLKCLNVKFNTEKIFSWSNNKRYDFYIPSINCIIETHGGQHYDNGFEQYSGKTLDEQQENDRLKEKLAKENGVVGYIIIDCRKSELKYIKNNILNSELSKVFDLSEVDWEYVSLKSRSSIYKEISDLWNSGHNVLRISKILNKNTRIIREYLKICSELNLCKYDSDKEILESKIRCGKTRAKKVFCKELNKIFDSLLLAEKETNISFKAISNCCKKISKTAGGYHWMYHDEYLKEVV